MTGSVDWVELGDLSFAVYDLDTEEVEKYDPESDTKNHLGGGARGAAERAVARLYEEVLDWEASNINHRENTGLKNILDAGAGYDLLDETQDARSTLIDHIESDVIEHISDGQNPLDVLDDTGIPDLLVYSRSDPERYAFVEVKKPPESLRMSQKNWFTRFDYLPRKIACMFESVEHRDRFVQENSVEDLLENVVEEEELDRPDMTPEEIASVLAEIDVGDELLFNDRKESYTVVEKGVTVQVLSKEITGVKVSSGRSRTVLSSDGKWYRGSMYRRSLDWVEVVG